jgi:hypothetical protein
MSYLKKVKKKVEYVVNELCEKGIITSKMTTFKTHNNDGTLVATTPARILVMRDADRENGVQALSIRYFNPLTNVYIYTDLYILVYRCLHMFTNVD